MLSVPGTVVVAGRGRRGRRKAGRVRVVGPSLTDRIDTVDTVDTVEDVLTVELAGLHRGPRSWSGTVADPGEVWPDVPGRFQGPAELALRAQAAGDGSVHVTGRLAATLVRECRRCLREVEERVELGLDIWYRPGSPEEMHDEAVFPLEAETGMSAGDVEGKRRANIDLVPALREELVLAVSNYPLCRPDCAGLCPRCGARRDEEECDCTLEEADPRWDALRALR